MIYDRYVSKYLEVAVAYLEVLSRNLSTEAKKMK
jgi:hypothetical protein